MKIFGILQNHYATFGITSSNQLDRKLPFSKRVHLGFLLILCANILHVMYIFHVACDFKEYIESICATSTCFVVLVCFAAIVFRQTTLFESIDKIEKLIDTRSKYPESEAFFLKTNQRVERSSEMVLVMIMKISLQCAMLPKCFICFGLYFFTDLGSDSFQLPSPFWFPFDTNNPIGYLIAIILEYIMLAYEFFTFACSLAFGIGACSFAISVTKDIQRILHLINEKAQANKDNANENQSLNQNELQILFTEFIDTHSAIKQIMHDFSDLLQPMIMSFFTLSLLLMSSALLIVQLQIMHHGSVMSTFLTIFGGIFALATVFVNCELGQKMINAFNEIQFIIGKSDWYLFPIEIQRMLPAIIANAQQPVSLKCFGSIACTREVFKQVIRCTSSYFMLLRHLDV